MFHSAVGREIRIGCFCDALVVLATRNFRVVGVVDVITRDNDKIDGDRAGHAGAGIKGKLMCRYIINVGIILYNILPALQRPSLEHL